MSGYCTVQIIVKGSLSTIIGDYRRYIAIGDSVAINVVNVLRYSRVGFGVVVFVEQHPEICYRDNE